MGIDLSMEGLEEVLGKLERMGRAAVLRAARRGMQQELQTIRKEAADNCPVDTGRLRESIRTRTRIEDGVLTGEVYAGVEYAVYVEMGTGPKGEASHGGVNPEWLKEVTYSPKGWAYTSKDGELRYNQGVPARPFLYPAYKANEAGVKEAIGRAVIRAVQEGDG